MSATGILSMQCLPVTDCFRLIEPGPIVLVTTQGSDGPNVMTMGFHQMVRHDPPLIGCVLGPWNASHAAFRETGECVIAVPVVDMARIIVDIGNCSGRDVDKFDAFAIETSRSDKVIAPLISGCIANIECRIYDDALSDRYNFHVLEVVGISAADDWRDQPLLHHLGDGCFSIGEQRIDHSDRMTRWRGLPGAS